MDWTIPGTVLPIPRQEADRIEERFSSMFLAGGMVLSQVSSITGLEPHTIQNWVKRGYLSPPVRKRYTQRQLSRILIINMLRAALPLERICGLLQYINGHLDDEADDLIDDTKLYFLFIRLAAYHRQMKDTAGREDYLSKVLADYAEPVPGAKQRVENVLRIMLTAWAAAQLRQAAENMVTQLYENEGEM
jgi:DNA-binding transcriptional MerR regulator